MPLSPVQALPASTNLAERVWLIRGSLPYRHASMALFLAGFATFSLLYCVQPLLPIFSKEFSVTPTQSSLSLSLSTGFLAVAVFLAAPISEVCGRRGLMFGSMLAAAALNLAASFAPNWYLLLVLRAIEGIVLGGVPAVAMAYLAEEIDPQGLGFSMGLYVAGTAFGGMAGRVLTGILAEASSWRIAMAVISLCGLAAAAGFFAWLPPSRNFRPQSGMDLSFHLRAWGRHLSDPALALLFLIAFLAMGAFVATYNYAGFRLTAPPYNLNQTQLGLIFTVYLFGIGASSLAGLLTDRIDRRIVLPLGVVLTASGIALTLFAPLTLIILGIVLLTSGFFVVHSVASAWVGRLAKSAKGHASSLYLLLYYLGSSAMGSAGGWFYARGGWGALVAFTLTLLALAFCAGAALYRIVPARATP